MIQYRGAAGKVQESVEEITPLLLKEIQDTIAIFLPCHEMYSVHWGTQYWRAMSRCPPAAQSVPLVGHPMQTRFVAPRPGR